MDVSMRIACTVLLLTAVTLAQFSSNKEEGDYCTVKNGNAGICRLIGNCPAAIAMIRAGKIPEICSFVDESAVVCCPEGTNNQVMPGGTRPQNQRPPSWPMEGQPSDNKNPPRRPDTSTSTNRPHFPSEENVVYKPDTTSFQSQETERPGGRRMNEIKCKEYSAVVTQEVEALPLLLNPDPVKLTIPNCDIEKLPLIVGGEKTVAGEFPHMAAVGYGDEKIEWNCGGSLISDYYVLTAAHCTSSSKGPPVKVRLGELNLKSNDDDAQPEDFRIVDIIRHPQYKAPSKYNDIALLRLARKVNFNKFIRPACLYNQDTFPGNKTVATGWGRIDYAEKPSDVLLKVALDIIDNTLCNELYKTETGQRTLARGIIPDMMCAGVLAGGMDTCQGDSGGPIQITKVQNKCVYYVIGVTSFGKFCAAAKAPGVYTRVSHYVSWIESIVWT